MLMRNKVTNNSSEEVDKAIKKSIALLIVSSALLLVAVFGLIKGLPRAIDQMFYEHYDLPSEQEEIIND